MASVQGIIYPPPDVKAIIDKTAAFVARNGIEFEGRIRAHERDNPKFKFLESENPYHTYYVMKVDDSKRKQTEPPPPPEPETTNQPEETPQTQINNSSDANVIAKPAPYVPKENPCPTIFTIPIPEDITPLDLDIIKLTAQYVARNGQTFLSNITSREHRNPQFDFLKGHAHRWFQFFHSLVDAYTKIIIPPKDTIESLRADVEDKLHILERCVSGSEWKKMQEAKRKADEDEEERERVAFQLIDWHDFVIVETIDFQEDMDIPMPPSQLIPTPVPPPNIAPPPMDIPAPIPPPPIRPTHHDSDESGDEDGDRTPSPRALRAGARRDQKNGGPQAMDEDDDEIVVRKDYQRVIPKPNEPLTVVDLQTGQIVQADQATEHMRIKTLDPKWKEQQKREREKQATTNIAPDSDMSGVLNAFAERRTDIFGDVEGELGQSADVLREKQKDKSTRPPVVVEPTPSILPRFDMDKTKPPVPSLHVNPPNPYVQMIPPPPGGLSQMPVPPRPAVPGMASIVPIIPMNMPNPHFIPGLVPPSHISTTAQPPPPAMPFHSILEPDPKRPKIDHSLLTAEIQVHVILPQIGGTEWELDGQTVTVTVSGNATINEIKEKVQTLVGVPPSKNQLKDARTTSFLKDSNTLAELQLSHGATLELVLRERGGQKKKK